MIKKLLITLFPLAITIGVYSMADYIAQQPFDISNYPTLKTTINNQEITLATVWTPELQAKGFMYVSEIPEDQGMLFTYPEEKPRNFWMKDTIVPLDIIFLDQNYQIINIHHNARPCNEIDPTQQNCPSYSSQAPSQYIIELPSPQAKNLNLQPGQTIRVEFE